jgi:broad specificity phosphatase PhoE
MSETVILLVRHPETEANVSGRFVGRGQTPFTPVGRRQLRRLPRKIAAFDPDTIWSSPLKRALVLAQAAARMGERPLVIDEHLIELHFGEAEGLTYDEIVRAGIPFDYRDADSPVAPGGESRSAIERRSAAFMDEVVAQGGRHAVITHGGVFRASLVHLLGFASSDIWAFHIHNAQMALVRVGDGYGVLEEYRQG